MSLLVDVND